MPFVRPTQVNWVRPVDNGGSPITSYRLFMESPDGNVTQVVISPAASALAIAQNGTLAYAPVGEQVGCVCVCLCCLPNKWPCTT